MLEGGRIHNARRNAPLEIQRRILAATTRRPGKDDGSWSRQRGEKIFAVHRLFSLARVCVR